MNRRGELIGYYEENGTKSLVKINRMIYNYDKNEWISIQTSAGFLFF
ncbi:hypothetical protein ACIQZM_05150 [Peribacillus sp. NPDC097206]